PAPAPPYPHPTGAFAPDSTHTEDLASGVRHTEMRIPSGPWMVHVVEVAPGACGVDLHTAKGLDQVIGRERPSEMARRTAIAAGRPVLAAVNADFFSFQPPGVPEGPEVSAGRVVKGEGTHREAVTGYELREQPAFGVGADGKPFFADAHLDGWLRIRGDSSAPLPRVNPPAANESVALYNSYRGARTPTDTGVVEVIVRIVRAAAMAGDTAVGVILRVDTTADGVDIPSDGVVLAERAHPGAALQLSLQAGDSVWWSLHFRGAPARVKELVGGFPMLLRDGVSVLGEIDAMIPGFSVTQHARTVVGLRADGTVLLVAVDGRSADSKGMSLVQLTAFMQALGATDALNLDGGGSTALVLDGRVANHPSDKEGERAVANALLVLGDGKNCVNYGGQGSGGRVQELQGSGSRDQGSGTTSE
ncbi:MAG TPA: phosphodiester glycosidase family protein, partial [Gemmatimonadaceae bacterium]